MFGTSWRAGRIVGIEIRIDSSWVVIALLITYSMYLRFSFLYKGLSTEAAVGQHRVWGGLVPAERAALRRSRWPA